MLNKNNIPYFVLDELTSGILKIDDARQFHDLTTQLSYMVYRKLKILL